MNVRRVLVSVGLLAFVVIIAANLGRLSQLPQIFGHVNLFILVLLIPVQLVGYYFNAKFYQSFLKIMGYKVEVKRLYKAAMAINFVNQAFPSGGISGISYFANDLSDEVPGGKSTLAQLGWQVFGYLSFLIVLGVGFLLLFYGGNVYRVTVRLILLFIIILLGVGIFIAAIINQRSMVESITDRVIGLINRFWHRIRHRALVGTAQLKHFLDDFYQGKELLFQQRGLWHQPALYALLGNITEVATVYVVFMAFGHPINPGVVIAAYTVANIFSLTGVATNGAGAYEAAMIATLVALGQSFSLSFSIVLVYRVVNMATFLPAGFYFYRQRVRRNRVAT